MSFPTTGLQARFEPKDWGYSNGDVINTSTKKFLDGTANAAHMTTVTGSPTFNTGGVNSQPFVRFSGSSQDVRNNTAAVGNAFATGTIAGVFVVRGTFGNNYGYFTYNNQGSNNGNELAISSSSGLFGYFNGTSTPFFYKPQVGSIDILSLDYDNSASGHTNHVRVNGFAGATVASGTGQKPGASFSQFSLAQNGFNNYVQIDVYALFIYNVQLSASDQTALEDYLYTTYINPSSPALPTQRLVGQYRADDETYADAAALGSTNFITDQSGQSHKLDSNTNVGGTFKKSILGPRSVYRFDGASGTVGEFSTGGAFSVSTYQHTIAAALIPRGSIVNGRRYCWAHGNTTGGWGAAVSLNQSGGVGIWEGYEYDGTVRVASGGTPAVGTADYLTLRAATASTTATTASLRVNGTEVSTVGVATLQTTTTQFGFGGNDNGSTTAAQVDVLGGVVYDTPVGGQWLTDIETWTSALTSFANGTGADTLALSSSGSAREIFLGTGADTLALSSAGSAREIFLGTGADTLALTSAGTGVVTAIAGTGADTLVLTSAGSAREIFLGTGADTLALTSAGSSTETISGSGAASLSLLSAGTGGLGYFGTGDDTLTLTDAGSGQEIFRGTGATTLALVSSGASTEIFRGFGASIITLLSAGSGGQADVFGSGADVLGLLSSGSGLFVILGTGSTVLRLRSAGVVHVIEVFASAGPGDSSVFVTGGANGAVFQPAGVSRNVFQDGDSGTTVFGSGGRSSDVFGPGR